MKFTGILLGLFLLNANSTVSFANESDKSSKVSKKDSIYVEIGGGWKSYSRLDYRFESDQDYSAGRWLDIRDGSEFDLNLGYYFAEDWRVSVGYKKTKDYPSEWYNGTVKGVFADGFSQAADIYIINIYKEFAIKNIKFVPYIGAGIGVANISRSADPAQGIESEVIGSPYGQLITGLSYSFDKYDLFSELSYGGTRELEWSSSNTRQKYWRNFAGKFGVRYRF